MQVLILGWTQESQGGFPSPRAADWSGPGWSRVEPCWHGGQGPTYQLCELVSEKGRNHANAMWLNFYLQCNSGRHFLLPTQNGVGSSWECRAPSVPVHIVGGHWDVNAACDLSVKEGYQQGQQSVVWRLAGIAAFRGPQCLLAPIGLFLYPLATLSSTPSPPRFIRCRAELHSWELLVTIWIGYETEVKAVCVCWAKASSWCPVVEQELLSGGPLLGG